jgi:hypothetical protein
MSAIFRVAVVVLLASAGAGGLRAQAPSLEYDIKAVFLLNFVRYVTWPPAHQHAPFRVCVLPPDPFGVRLDAALAGERWQGAAMALQPLAAPADAEDCHLLYVPAAATARFLAARAQLARRPVLTVGETRQFLTSGGIIHLFVDENRVRFSINQGAADTAGLQISSRLLRLAREVIARRDPGSEADAR